MVLVKFSEHRITLYRPLTLGRVLDLYEFGMRPSLTRRTQLDALLRKQHRGVHFNDKNFLYAVTYENTRNAEPDFWWNTSPQTLGALVREVHMEGHALAAELPALNMVSFNWISINARDNFVKTGYGTSNRESRRLIDLVHTTADPKYVPHGKIAASVARGEYSIGTPPGGETLEHRSVAQ